MSQKAGRNDSCPCGSGIKMKNCHPNGYGAPSKNRNILLITGGIAALVIVAVYMLTGDSRVPQQRLPAGSATNSAAGPGTPQPAGPAPEGKVWSTEHGHWHDALGAQATSNPLGQLAAPAATALTPPPDGPAPEGKVWSAEHGHWHNEAVSTQPSLNLTPAQPAQSEQPEQSGP